MWCMNITQILLVLTQVLVFFFKDTFYSHAIVIYNYVT